MMPKYSGRVSGLKRGKRQKTGRMSYITKFNKAYRGYIGKELKYDDTTYNGVVGRVIGDMLRDPGGVDCLTNIAQGTGNTQRDGLKVHIKSISIRGKVRWDPIFGTGANSTLPTFKLWVVMDTQTNRSQMASSEFFKDTGVNNFDDISFRNLENTARFRVLKEIKLSPPLTPGAGNGSQTGLAFKNFEIHIPNIGCFQRYTGTGGTVSNIADCSFHVLAVKSYYDNGTADLTAPVTLTYVCRTRFYAL
jgi:hypothetical protein